jgi:hypothetical protein
VEQQLEYWRKGSDSLRKQMKPANQIDTGLGDRGVSPH